MLFSLAEVFLIAPIMITVDTGLNISDEGYVFYYQGRIGLRNRFFNIIKLSKMFRDSAKMP